MNSPWSRAHSDASAALEGFGSEEGIVPVLKLDGSRLDEVVFQGWEDVQRELGAVGALEVAELGQQRFLPWFDFQRIAWARPGVERVVGEQKDWEYYSGYRHDQYAHCRVSSVLGELLHRLFLQSTIYWQ